MAGAWCEAQVTNPTHHATKRTFTATMINQGRLRIIAIMEQMVWRVLVLLPGEPVPQQAVVQSD